MNARIIAAILIVFGVVVLTYSGIYFRTPGKPVDLGPIHVETTRSHYIPPVTGTIALVGGILLMFTGRRKD